MPPSTSPTHQPSHALELEVHGALPPELSGRMIGIGPDGFVQSFHMHGGGVTYATRRVHPGVVVRDVVAFEGSILAFGADSSVHQLSTDINTLRRVELAGHGRELVACPTYDPTTGELHLVARDADGALAHVVVPAGALTRRSRPIVGTPSRIQGIALGRDLAVFAAHDVVGVTSRVGEAQTTWISTGAAAPRLLHAHRTGATVVLLTLTPLLERWTLHLDSGAVERSVLDPTARHFARTGGVGPDGSIRHVWTTGDETISRHDVVESRTLRVDLAPQVPGDFVLIPDATRPGTDGGWVVGMVHDPSAGTADIRVIDMADPAKPAVATIRVPRSMPRGLRCAWLPSTAN